MPPAWQLSCLQSRIRSLTLEINRVKNKEHPYPEPEIVFNALLDVIKSRQDLINEFIELSSEEVTKQPVFQPVFDSLVKDLADVAYYFSLVDRVDSARIPFEILRSLSWMANLLLHEECRSVVRLDPNYNYTISSFRHIFERLGWEKQWRQAIPRECNPEITTVLVLGFPSADASSILMHALAAHELGHEFIRPLGSKVEAVREESISRARKENQEALQDYLVERSRVTGLDDRVTENAVGQLEFSSDPFDEVSSGSGKGRTVTRPQNRGDAYEASRRSFELHLAKVVENWFTELFADLVAARLVGPAFLAAFDRLVVGETQPYKTHPPAGMRRKLVRDYLCLEFPEIMQKVVWKQLCDPYQRYEPPKDFVWKICCDVCRFSLPGLTRIVEDVPSPFKQTANLDDYIRETKEYIENLAPPSAARLLDSEIIDSHKFWLLMFCTWDFRLDEERFSRFAEKFGWANNLPAAEEAIGNLLLHSLRSL